MRPNINLPRDGGPKGTVLGFVYALLAYAFSQAAFVYFVLFINGIVVPKGVDDGEVQPWPAALAVNVGLVLLWGLQHSVMARQAFKARWTRIVPPHTERATYCLGSGIALMIVMLAWVPIDGTVWSVGPTWARMLIVAAQAAAWLMLVAASFEIDHFDTFGLKQPFYAMKGKPPKEIDFQIKRIYRVIRHPIQSGIFIGMWAAPTMSSSRFMFAALMTAYILVGLYFEERDLVRQFGDRYRRYRQEVPKLLPWKLPEPRRSPSEASD